VSGHIVTVPARDLKVGDVFSTDSMEVQEVDTTTTPGVVYVRGVCHGTEKRGVLNHGDPCHLWVRDA
jgi:hypothetical protein